MQNPKNIHFFKIFCLVFVVFFYSCAEERNLDMTLLSNKACKNGNVTLLVPNANTSYFGDKPYITFNVPCTTPKVAQCQIRKEIMDTNFMTEADAKIYLRPLCE